jgi:hypothetical protein
MRSAVRLFSLILVAQACVPLRHDWPEAIDRSPCFIYIDTPLPPGAAPPRQSYIRLRNHPADIPGGNALELYQDSGLTHRGWNGTWVTSGRDTLRFDYWSVPTTILTLRRQDPERWSGELTYGGDAIVNGRPAIGHSRIDLIPYRCPASA